MQSLTSFKSLVSVLLRITIFAFVAPLSTLVSAYSEPVAVGGTDETGQWYYGEESTYSTGATQPDIWSRIRNGLQLGSHIHRAPVRAELDDLVQHLPSLLDTLEASRPFLYHVVTEVEKRNLPMEVALLPFIESKFEPYAHSIYGASGPWQFMPSTARHYGLRLDWWFDGRRDVLRSTSVALDYIEHLAAYFNGDWFLAIAAYNTGQGRVRRLRNSYDKDGLNTDFWSLGLPRETRRYVPALLALAELIRWGKVNDTNLPDIPNRTYIRPVKLPGQADLLKIAQSLDLDLEALLRYNAGFRRWATPPQGPHRLLLPLDLAERLDNMIIEHEVDFSVDWESYLVKPGDTINSIAEIRGVHPAVIRQLNELHNTDIIRAHEYILVPSDSAEILPRGGLVQHKIQSGETLQDIALYYGLDPRDIVADNFLKPGKLPVGKVIQIDLGPELPEEVKGIAVASYRVRHGDSLSVIAKRFNTTVDELMTINGLDSSALYLGWELTIPLKNQR